MKLHVLEALFGSSSRPSQSQSFGVTYNHRLFQHVQCLRYTFLRTNVDQLCQLESHIHKSSALVFDPLKTYGLLLIERIEDASLHTSPSQFSTSVVVSSTSGPLLLQCDGVHLFEVLIRSDEEAYLQLLTLSGTPVTELGSKDEFLLYMHRIPSTYLSEKDQGGCIYRLEAKNHLKAMRSFFLPNSLGSHMGLFSGLLANEMRVDVQFPSNEPSNDHSIQIEPQEPLMFLSTLWNVWNTQLSIPLATSSAFSLAQLKLKTPWFESKPTVEIEEEEFKSTDVHVI